MSLIHYIALVCESKNNKRIQFRQLASVCAALQKQMIRDFSPIWGVQATVDPFERLEDVPLGYWPIIVADDIDDPGIAGLHEDRMGQPFSLVQASELWSLTASHECLEMLADPFGNRTIAGQRPGEDGDESSVEFLVEICDPCEDVHYAYEVNGIPVSDFYTPDYFSPVRAAGLRYDFGGHIQEPRQVLPNGYLSWYDPRDGNWWQLRGFGSDPKKPVHLRIPSRHSRSMRSVVDSLTPTPLEEEGLGINCDSREHTVVEGRCISCPSCQAFNLAFASGRLLADGGGVISGPTTPPEGGDDNLLVEDGGGVISPPPDPFALDAERLREDVKNVKAAAEHSVTKEHENVGHEENG